MNRASTAPEKLLHWATLVILFILFYKLLTFQGSLLTNPFPNEYREGSILQTTQALLDGKNPYALANQPEYTNVYGMLYHLVVYPFAKLFGNSFPVHRAVSAGFILGSCGVMFWILRWMRTPWVLSLGTTLILYGHLLFYITPLARPDGMGVFFLLLSVVLPFRYDYSARSMAASIILGILAFLIKPYCILGLAFVVLYVFVFKSKLDGLKYGVYATLGFLSTMALMNSLGESYINNTFLIHVNVASKSAEFLYRQLGTYGQTNAAFLALLVLGSILGFVQRRSQRHQQPLPSRPKRLILKPWQSPLIDYNMGLFPWCALMYFGVFYISMGRHTGNWMVYLHQLLSPFLLLTLAMVAKALYPEGNITSTEGNTTIRLLTQGLASLLIVLNVSSVASVEFLPGLPKDYQKTWQALRGIVGEHRKIFNSPAIASLLIQQGKPVYDSGQSEYFIAGTKREAKLSSLFPNNAAVVERNNAYLNQIEQDVINHQYELVIVTNDRSPILPAAFLEQYYNYAGYVHAPMPPAPFIGARNWLLDIYEPKTAGSPPAKPDGKP
jgi:hypothetical protein